MSSQSMFHFLSNLIYNIYHYMPLFKDQSICRPVSVFINLSRDEKTAKENIRVSSNHISILDDQGEIIEEIVPLGKILPTNLENQQINERTLVNSMDNFVKGMNLTVLYIGASFSGKEKLFDGNKNQLPLAYHFAQKLFPTLRQRYRKYEVRMKAGLIVKEKIYDCNSQNKYGTLKIRENQWEGIELVNMNTLMIQNAEDFKKQVQRVVKQKNRLILEFKDLYTSYLSLTVIREPEDDEGQGKVICTASFFQIPGVELLSQSHNSMKSKESSLSTKSLFNFASILNDYNRNPEAIPEYDSVLGLLLKQNICGNSNLVVYYNLRTEDIQGSRGAIKFLKLTDNLQQYPIVNSANTFGLLRKFRAEMIARRGKVADKDTEQQKNFLQNEIMRVKTQDDYNRLLQKYSQLKNKYNVALKAKSEAQLQLIKCEQQKLQIGKSLVQVQIQNTKLLQKLQNKDYQNGKRVLQTQNKLAKKQSSFQECLDKIQELQLALNQALETKRDLEVQFIALKRNFIMQKNQSVKLRQDNQNLSLDVINLSNQNEQLKRDFVGKNSGDQRSKIMLEMQNQKYDQLKRETKKQQETINYLKSQIDRYKKELIQRQVGFQKQAKKSGLSGYGKDYDRIELQNQNLELQNRIKLLQRKIEEMEEKVGFYQEENGNLEEENKKMRTKEVNDTNEYRRKLEELSKTSNYQAIVKELRDNFAKKDAENLNKINNLKRIESEKKKEIANLKSYMRQILALLDQWSPKGAQIPAIRKFKSLDLNSEEDVDELSDLRIKNVRLEEQVRKLKASGGQMKSSGGKSKPNQAELRQSRVNQQYNYLKNSQSSNRQIQKMREQNNRLAEQNRRLTVLLKDGNKMDLNLLRKQNDNFRKQIDQYRNQSSVSPSTNDQKLVFYQKHLKVLQRERSQLLSRCVVAQEQVKNLLAKVGRAKN